MARVISNAKEATEIEKLRTDMLYYRKTNNRHGYKQAKKQYERAVKKEKYGQKQQ